ncbi:MAG: SUMF1/EgtB/PvdO family nonheme iron enzyme [Planctomycetota bacterium]|nr:SUMF1/EgtB/PvdO family nonheme iron enzyme [Planctomycetota bacterium]
MATDGTEPTAGTGEAHTVPPQRASAGDMAEDDTAPHSRPPQDLTGDPLLVQASMIVFRGAPRPALGGIPLLVKLGQGGMAAVYYGIDTRLGAEVAVKVLPLHLVSQNPDIVKRFLREAQIAGSINSPNLVPVRDVGQDSGYFYQVMEYVHGVTAGKYLKYFIKRSEQVGLPENEALEICIAAANGLADAHVRNVIHRDVKPDNILIPKARDKAQLLFSDAKLCDLGLARTERAEDAADVYVPQAPGREGPSLTEAGAAMGTWGYMAPEQAEDAKSAGKPADVFSLGATLYTLLAGHPPYNGDSVMERRLSTYLDRKEPITRLRRDVSPATAAFLERSLRKDSARRYRDGQAVLGALQDCLAARTRADAPTLTQEPPTPPVEAARASALVRAAEAAVHPLPREGEGAGRAGTGPPLKSAPGEEIGPSSHRPAGPRQSRTEQLPAEQAPAPPVSPSSQEVARGSALGAVPAISLPAEPRRSPRKLAVKTGAIAALVAATIGAGGLLSRYVETGRAVEREAFTAAAKPPTNQKPETGVAGALPKELALDLGKGVTLELVLIPAGRFLMGSPATEDEREQDETQHEVIISRPFYMGKYEVTQEQYEAVMGENPSRFKGAKHPVEMVSWDEAQEFCRKASAKTGKTVKLPTEAEWEYACRAGTTTVYCSGDDFEAIKQVTWCSYDGQWGSAGGTTPVGSLKPNAWGLYDMHGNAYEWCEDWYGDYPERAATDPKGTAEGDGRVTRGGSWFHPPRSCRSADRNRCPPREPHDDQGFRVVVAGLPAKVETDTVTTHPDTGPVQPETEAVQPPTTDQKQETAVAGALPKELVLDLGKGVTLELVLIPAGKFLMGSPATEKERDPDETQHEVTISKPFYMGKYEVTQEQYEAVTGWNLSYSKGARDPVENVSWDDAQEFCKKASATLPLTILSPRGGQGKWTVRLPTEAEWEYACRAGTTTRFSSGDTDSALADVAWYDANSEGKTHAAGQKKPNAWGLYDMHGNVWEWCQDGYGRYAAGAATDPTGPATDDFSRVLRGGCWKFAPGLCRSAHRGRGNYGQRYALYGFRVVVGCAPSTTP